MKKAAFLHDDGIIRVYRLPDFAVDFAFKPGCRGHALAFSPDAKHFATGGRFDEPGSALIWDVSKSPIAPVKKLLPRGRFTNAELADFDTLCFSDDGKRLVGVDWQPHFFEWAWKDEAVAEQDVALNVVNFNRSRQAILLDDRHVLCLTRKGPVELYKLEGKELEYQKTVLAESWDKRLIGVTSDVKTLACWNVRDETVEVHDISKNRARLVEKVMYFRRLPEGERFEVWSVATVPDRTFVVVAYMDWKDRHIKLAFFPLAERRWQEFGLERRKDSHLFMSVAKEESDEPRPAWLRVSPNSQWLVLGGGSFQPRVWDLSTLGKMLLADPRVRKK